METMLPTTCSIKFKDPHKLHEFYLIVTPDEGFWQGGTFWFHIYITEDYNIAVSISYMKLQLFVFNFYRICY